MGLRIANHSEGMLTYWRQLQRKPELIFGAGLVAVLLFASACAHSRRGEIPAAALVPQTPRFLTSPMAVLLTNSSGFSAHVTVDSRTVSSAAGAVHGDLLGRGSQLLFQPASVASGKKAERASGSAFIWDVAQARGLLLNEALQGYAPIASASRPTNLLVRAASTNSNAEGIDGHPCIRQDIVVTSSDGTTNEFQVWRGTDLNGFPLRITATQEGITLNLAAVRLEAPPANLFQPPDGFAKYDSPDAMSSELLARQADYRRETPREVGEGFRSPPPGTYPGTYPGGPYR